MVAMIDSVFAERRDSVRNGLGDAVLLLPSAPAAIRNNDVEHEYRQDSDLYYLTGFDEPHCALVLSKDQLVMFVQPKNPERETWDGPRAGVEGAQARFGADVAHAIEDLPNKLSTLFEDRSRLYYRLGRDRGFDDVVLRAIDLARAKGKQGKRHPVEIVDPATILHELRLTKAETELSKIRRAIEITAEAHLAAMSRTKPGCYEYEIEAVLRSVFRRHGSERPAYAPIVGSGPNATILHHRRNDRQMSDGELLLIDAGCEFDYYAADVTRTFPVGRRFTDTQRQVYDVVLEAQLASIGAVAPGNTLDDIHDKSVHRIARGLVDLGLIEGPVNVAIEENRYKPFFMHKTSHYLGMDVHDVGAYFVNGKPRPLEPGMVITVEPGIYIPSDADVPDEFRGVGIRIEDDVVVTGKGGESLSSSIPKKPDEVERACNA